jgi:polysaccharide pyruvyl transferase WcaK-like protein
VVVTRDPISTKEARRLGCQVVRECPDIAWTFENGRVGSEVLPARLPSVGRYGVVIVSGETPKLDDVFLARLGELSRRVLDEGLVDTLVVALQSLEDRAVTSRFVRSRDPRYILLDDDFSPEELMALYRDARFLMGRRLHAGVFALLGGTPTILFSTDGVKTDGVMSELGLSDRVFPYPDFPVEDAHRLLVTMLEHHEGEKKAILEKVSAARRRAERELGAIAALLRVEAPAPAIGLEATT